MSGWLKFIRGLIGGILPADQSVVAKPEPDFFTVVDQTKREWDTARAYFNNVTDPDLVDHAIFLLEAAERKYVYLFKQARRNRVAPDATREIAAVRQAV